MPEDSSKAASTYNKDSITNIFVVAVVLCLVCSIVVSTAAVAFKPMQKANEALDRKRNILLAAGLLQPGQGASAESINSQFEQFDVRIVDLADGRFSDAISNPATYDQIRAAKDPATSTDLTSEQDIATIGRVEQYATVYIKRRPDNSVETLVLPVRGYGLWGTLFGYLALNGDFRTIAGLGFYAHKETPGLGGEVDNPAWKHQWVGVEAFDPRGQVAVHLVKTRSNSTHEVDALSGATLTSRGVQNLVHFWLGDLGYGKFLHNLQDGSLAVMPAPVPVDTLIAAGGAI